VTTEDKSAKPEVERRREVRRRLLVGARVASETGTPLILGELVDLSLSGARMILLGPFDVGARVRVTLDQSLSNRTVRFDGKIMWREQIETGFAHGLELIEISSETEALIGELIGPSD